MNPNLIFELAADDGTKIDSATVQLVAYLLKHDDHRYAAMNGEQALNYAANALLKADRDCMQ